MRLIFPLLAVILLAISPASAEPKFGDYPSKIHLKDSPVLPRFVGSAAQFKTRIRNGMKTGPNYGGHFSVIEIGCGTYCVFAFLIDGRDGRMVDFPLGGEKNYQLQLHYRVDSTLLQADWMDTQNGQYDTCVRRFYDVGSGNLTKVSEATYKVERNSFCQ